MKTYRIVRIYLKHPKRVVKSGLTMKEVRNYLDNPETSSSTCKTPKSKAKTRKYGPWYDTYEEE